MLTTLQAELQHHLLDVWKKAAASSLTGFILVSTLWSRHDVLTFNTTNCIDTSASAFNINLSRSASHLPEDDLFALSVAYEQQQAADQQLLLQRETLSIRAAALRRHPVAVHLRQNPRDLRKADPWSCTQPRTGRVRVSVQVCQVGNNNQQTLQQIKSALTFSFSFWVWCFLPLVRLHNLHSSPGKSRSTIKCWTNSIKQFNSRETNSWRQTLRQNVPVRLDLQ